MNSQHLNKWNYEKQGKKCLCSPCHPTPATEGIYVNREPGIHKPVWYHSTGVAAAFPPFLQKARTSKSLFLLGLCDDFFILTPSCLLSCMEARAEAVNISPFPRQVP